MSARRIRRSVVVAGLGLLALHVVGVPAGAQSNSLFGNRGASTARPNGSSTSSLGGSTLGSSGFGSTTMGSSGFGSTSSMGGSGFGTNSARGGTGMTSGTGMGNTLSMNQGGFLGANSQGVFVGGGQLGLTSGVSSATGSGSLQGLSGLSRGMGSFGAGGQNRQQQRGTNQFGQSVSPNAAVSAFRPQQRIAFEFDQPTREQVTTSLRGTISDVASRRPELNGVSVVLDEEGEATLRGTVRTPAARGLAEALVRIEPGVRRVRNELTVAGR